MSTTVPIKRFSKVASVLFTGMVYVPAEPFRINPVPAGISFTLVIVIFPSAALYSEATYAFTPATFVTSRLNWLQ